MGGKKIKAIRVVPGGVAETITLSNDLRTLQDEVGGYIEQHCATESIAMLCNEEAALSDLAPSVVMCGVLYRGTVIFVGLNEGEWVSLSHSDEGDILDAYGSREIHDYANHLV